VGQRSAAARIDRIAGATVTASGPDPSGAHDERNDRAMALRQRFERLRAPIEELDRAALQEWTAGTGSTPIVDVVPRRTTCVAGEASSVRIVPRAGSPSLEVTVTDGTGFATGVFLGRRRIAGITPGRRLRFEGVASRKGRIIEIFNPRYDILR